MNADVVVIGAGFAGLSAAVRLSAAGLTVVVVEEAPRLGGRATAFTDRETGERVDNGQHVLFGCYRETYDFLRAIGTDTMAPLQSRLHIQMAGGGRRFDLRCPSVRPPWHLILGVLGWRALAIRDRLAVLGLRSVLDQARRDGAEAVARRVSPHQTVSAWLAEHHQSKRLCQWLWNPLAIAALNQLPDVAAAAPFVRVLAELFGPRVEDSSIGLPIVPLDELYAEPARRLVEQAGGRVLTKAAGRIVPGEDAAVCRVRAGGELIAATAVVSAVPWHAVERLFEPHVPPPLFGLSANATAMASSPIVTANLWFDGPVTTTPFVGLIDGSMHWVFDKAAMFGASRAGHLSVVASGADDIARLDNAEIAGLAMSDLAAALPAVRSRRLIRSVVVREHRATFSLAPGGPVRPPSQTPLDGFFLAGDWTDTGLPGTIESAVVSGHRAAALAIAYVRDRAARRPPRAEP